MKKPGKEKHERRKAMMQKLAPLNVQKYFGTPRRQQVVDPEASDPSRSETGVLRVNTGMLTLPEGLRPEHDSSGRGYPNVALIIILALAIGFIIFIAWMISRADAPATQTGSRRSVAIVST